MHIGDPSVGDPGLRAIQDPFVLGLVVDRARLEGADVGPGVRLAHAEGAHLDLVGRPEALRHPLDDLLRRPVGDDPSDAKGRAEDAEADAGVAPEELFVGDRHRKAGRVGEGVLQELEGVQPDLGGLLDDRPGRLFALVPLVGRRADDILGEAVNPLLDLPLLVVQLHRELRRLSSRPFVSLYNHCFSFDGA